MNINDSEHHIQKEVGKRLDALIKQGLPIWYFKTHGSRFQTAGIPDIIGCFWGVFVGIELKANKPTAKLSRLQSAIAISISKAHGRFYIVWNIDTFNEAIKDVFTYSKHRTGEASEDS